MSRPLAAADREWLLRAARHAIRQALCADGSLERFLGGAGPPRGTGVERGAFVTLHHAVDGTEPPVWRLRGCVGTTAGTQALHRAVIDLAPRSALEDPRFAPLTREEFDTVRISISVLTADAPLSEPARIAIGRHGVRLEHDRGQAVFLPQVAAEQRWSVEELLKQLALKAGLGPQDWRDAALSTFEAETFAEAGSRSP